MFSTIGLRARTSLPIFWILSVGNKMCKVDGENGNTTQDWISEIDPLAPVIYDQTKCNNLLHLYKGRKNRRKRENKTSPETSSSSGGIPITTDVTVMLIHTKIACTPGDILHKILQICFLEIFAVSWFWDFDCLCSGLSWLRLVCLHWLKD